MEKIEIEELINYKVLPYDVYSKSGEKLFAAGEVLTPGKLTQLKNIKELYCKDIFSPLDFSIATDSNTLEIEQLEKEKASDLVIETFDMKSSTIVKNDFLVDDINVEGYKGPINKQSKIDPKTQLKIKAFYNKIVDSNTEKKPLETLSLVANVRDKIVQDILSGLNDVFLSSQLKLLGEYNKCHALNTAILSGALAKKMNLPEQKIYDIVLSGLLHDIGKNEIPQEILSGKNLTYEEGNILQEHTIIGYKIIKNDMGLSDNIAKTALEHHENNDGSGYPSGKSGEQISLESQIINVCNYFDNLTSNRTSYNIKNTKDALRIMLKTGTQKFSPQILYKFVHMFNYNDTINFEEMVL
jgi:putative nucleotidyltransferase with HDIG domain